MKRNITDPCKSSLFLNNDGASKCWIEISCGIRADGSTYHNTNERFPLDITPFGEDETAIRNYLATEVRKVVSQTHVERISDDTLEMLPKGFAL
jgi:hypothetical protein